MRALIVSADDFGLCTEVNEAVERAHRDGILSTTSLMVAAPGTADAVARARALPSLRVGLHVVLVNGRPQSPPEIIPDLVDARGEFFTDLAHAGVAFFFRPGIRRQLETEVRAQFRAFAATGLPLDHVNAQNHMHVHPTVFGIVLRVAREFGAPAIRVPYEPFAPSWRSTHTKPIGRWCNAALLAPWLRLMKARLRRARLASNDYVFGMVDTGHMTAERVLRYLANLPEGVTEMYFHPATRSWKGVAAGMHDYEFAGEFGALVDPRVVAAVNDATIIRTTYTDLARG